MTTQNGLEVMQQWASFMGEKIGRTICDTRGDGLPVPYLTASSGGTDGFLYFLLDGHEVKAGHSWIDQDDLSEPIAMPASKYEGENVFIGYKSDMGMSLMIDPSTIIYTQDGDDRPHPMSLLLDTIGKEYFEGWKEGQLDIRLSAIFSRMSNQNASSLEQEVERAQGQLQRALRNLDPLYAALSEAQRKVIAARSLDIEVFRQQCQGWEELLLNQGALNIDRENNLILRIPQFTINDGSDWNEGNGVQVPLGPLRVRYNLQDHRIKVSSDNNETLSHSTRYPHPHVSREGDICWGDSTHVIENVLRNPNPMEVLFTVAHFLKEGYHEPGAYTSLRNWLPPSGWMCSHCNVRHQDGTRCPHQCPRCDQYVSWDTHAHCDEHNVCYDRPGMCPVCLSELPELSSFGLDTSSGDIPQIIQPPKYTRPQQGDERTAHYDYVGIGPNPLIPDPNNEGNFIDFVRQGQWHWIQSPNEEDSFLRNGQYIYKKQENGTYALHWINPQRVEQSEAQDDGQNEQSNDGDSGIDANIKALFDHYYTQGQSARDLTDALHTDRIPSYDDVLDEHRNALRQFRRRSTTARLRLTQRYVESLNQDGLGQTGS